jgi:hypothetical protein
VAVVALDGGRGSGEQVGVRDVEMDEADGIEALSAQCSPGPLATLDVARSHQDVEVPSPGKGAGSLEADSLVGPSYQSDLLRHVTRVARSDSWRERRGETRTTDTTLSGLAWIPPAWPDGMLEAC